MNDIVIYEGFRIDISWADRLPRIQDLELAAALEYGQPRDIRKLIKRMQEQGFLTGISCRATVARQSTGQGGEREYETTEFWLTEEEALFVTSQGKTRRSREITCKVIKAFIQLRDYFLATSMAANVANAEPSLVGSDIPNIRAVELHAERLYKADKITKSQALDLITVAISGELGYDFTNIPTLEYQKAVVVAGPKGVQVDGAATVLPIKDKNGTVSAKAISAEHKVPAPFVTKLAVALGLIGDPAFTEKDGLASTHHGYMGENARYLPAGVEAMKMHLAQYVFNRAANKASKMKAPSRLAEEAVLSSITEKVGRGTDTSATTIKHPSADAPNLARSAPTRSLDFPTEVRASTLFEPWRSSSRSGLLKERSSSLTRRCSRRTELE